MGAPGAVAGDADRRFRSSPPAAPVPPASAPVNLTVTNLTLSPRFELIWNFWQAAAGRLEQIERSILTKVGMPADRHAPATVGQTQYVTARLESRVPHSSHQITERLLARRMSGHFTVSGATGRDGGLASLHKGKDANSFFQDVRAATGRRKIAVSRFRYATRATQQRGADRPRHVAQTMQSTVIRRHLQHVLGIDASMVKDAAAQVAHGGVPAPRHMDLSSASSPRRANAESTAPIDPPAVSPTGRRAMVPQEFQALTPKRGGLPGKAGRAERVFRMAEPVAHPGPPLSARPPTQRSAIPDAQQIDIAKLDTVLWQRFERRIRIEQERRGRG